MFDFSAAYKFTNKQSRKDCAQELSEKFGGKFFQNLTREDVSKKFTPKSWKTFVTGSLLL